MKVFAEQFDLPFVLADQLEMAFMSISFCPFWAFSWCAVCDLHGRDRRQGRWLFDPLFRAELPSMVAEIDRARNSGCYS